MPKGVDRDHTLLTTELSSLRDAFRIVYQGCRDTAAVPSAIPHYRSGESAGKALIDLTTNHVRILTYYRKLIGGGGAGRLFGTTNDPDFILVDDAAFRSQMRDAYGQKAYNVCVTQGDYAKQVDTRITNIGRKQDGIGQAEGEWKSAWPLLQNKNQAAEDKKTNQMDADLAKVGIEPNAPSVLENTEKNLTTTDDSQGLTGVMRTVGRMVSDALDQLGSLFTTEQKPLTAPESSMQVTDASARLGSSSQIAEHMTADFQAMMSQIAQQNVSFDESMSHLTKMLKQNEIADQEAGKRVETAEEICRRQDTKRGVCKQ